ncbi:MAG: hypothetical protein LBE10_03730 [Treponema sp.]|jgi:hypothetical protein|nr:hypothetical protein [Treponema sp.]
MKDLQKRLDKPSIEYWPDVRWWLAEGFHTDQTLKKDIQMLYDAGFGAVEFLAMDEPGADHALYGWGSEEWVHDSQTIVRETTERGMGVSFTSGTNWSNANLITISPDDRAAAKELDFTVESLKAGESRSGPPQKASVKMPNVNVQELIAVVAVKRTGERNGKILLDRKSALVLTGRVSGGNLDWTAPAGEWELFSFWLHGTGQTATPSVSVSYTVNYIDRYGIDALTVYWDKEILTRKLRDLIQKNRRVQMYMDSLELSTYGKGGQFWGYHFIEEFQKRRGYDLNPCLPFVLKKGGFMGGAGEYQYLYEPDDPADSFIGKLRNDLYQTMTELYIDNMLKPMSEWLHRNGIGLRAEISYGMPFEISLPGKYVDGIETESLEFASQIEPYRNLAGPAHLFNKLYSSETGAAMLNYQMGLDFYTQIIYTQFAAGVARTVLHGYSSIAGSESATYWPGHEGMWPIFSERFGSRQPAYRHYPGWTAMLARYQMILRQGKPRIDLGILRLDYNFNNMYFFGAEEKDIYENQLMRANQGIYWQDMGLQNAGYTFDYFAPQILEDEDIRYAGGELAPDGPGYRALVIYQEALPLSSAKRILALAKAGLPVVLVNGVTEKIRPALSRTHGKAASCTPFNAESDGELTAVIGELKALANVAELDDQSKTNETLRALGVRPRAAFTEPNKNILSAFREDGDKRYIFLYNYLYAQREAFDFGVTLEGAGKPWRLNCWTGEAEEPGLYARDAAHTTLKLTLSPGEAALIAVDTAGADPLYALSADTDSADSAGTAVIRRNGKLALKAFSSGIYRVKLSDGSVKKVEAAVPENIPLKTWDLEVEDWDEGEKKTIVEDRGLGIVTKEVYYETKKTLIPAGRTELKPWREIPALGPAVSGVGYYKTSFTLPADWSADNGALLCIGSTNGNSATVYVNGKKAPAFDFNRRKLDITALLVPGENSVTVEVSSTLNNRLLARNYHAIVAKTGEMMAQNFSEEEGMDEMSNMMNIKPPDPQDYGMTGEVKILTYTIKELI